MKNVCRALILVFLTLSTTPSYAQDQASQGTRRLDTLKLAYQRDAQEALKPIKERYAEQLKALMKELTQQGDLNGALAVQEELKSMTGESSTSLALPDTSGFSGTVWESRSTSSGHPSKITFRPDGTWSEDYASNPLRGHWKPTTDSKIVEVKISNGDVIHYKMSDDGTTCDRQEAHLTYEKKK
jgi:hypothetical protein